MHLRLAVLNQLSCRCLVDRFVQFISTSYPLFCSTNRKDRSCLWTNRPYSCSSHLSHFFDRRNTSNFLTKSWCIQCCRSERQDEEACFRLNLEYRNQAPNCGSVWRSPRKFPPFSSKPKTAESLWRCRGSKEQTRVCFPFFSLELLILRVLSLYSLSDVFCSSLCRGSLTFWGCSN